MEARMMMRSEPTHDLPAYHQVSLFGCPTQLRYILTRVHRLLRNLRHLFRGVYILSSKQQKAESLAVRSPSFAFKSGLTPIILTRVPVLSSALALTRGSCASWTARNCLCGPGLQAQFSLNVREIKQQRRPLKRNRFSLCGNQLRPEAWVGR
eukprot:m.636768 g.636768  ORF g.636768 m.636768 type:complete len:152 (-) comp58312_c0_seq27:403-858(-)